MVDDSDGGVKGSEEHGINVQAKRRSPDDLV